MLPIPSRHSAADELRAGLDRALPNPLFVGDGTALGITGWCFHPWLALRTVEIVIGDRTIPVALDGIQRRELREQFPLADDPHGSAEWAGFAAVLPIARVPEPTVLPIRVRAALAGGRCETAPLGMLQLVPAPPAPLQQSRDGELSVPFPESAGKRVGSAPRIAVCMTTYNPPSDLFARQIASLRAQTERDWICIVSDDHSKPERFAAIRTMLGDDARFRLFRQPTNRGYYRNFEDCLGRVPPEIEYVALADQDDVWHRDKLAVLCSRFGPRTTLVYSDARIVSADGAELASTYWTTRRPNRGDLATLLIANTVTGAAAMLRRCVLVSILPFPPAFGAAFHDHWIACAALARGEIAFIDQPLYDYVQHRGNVIGHFAPPVFPLWTRAWRWLKFFWLPKLGRNIRVALGNGRTHFFDNWLRVQQIAATLRLRCAAHLSADHRRALDRVQNPIWLAALGGRHASGLNTTVGMEFHMLHARLWATYMRAKRSLTAGRRIRDVSRPSGRRAAA
jgi:glycosyltransferase involved in cell wall biosynthesis